MARGKSIKISDNDFRSIYSENTVYNTAKIIGASEGYVYVRAKRMGLRKNFVRADRRDPKVIPGGLPQKEI